MRGAAISIVTVVFSIGLPARIAGAQDPGPPTAPPAEAPEPEAPAELLAPRDTSVVLDTVEEAVPSARYDALVANAQLMNRLMKTSAEETIREQKFGAAAGITGGTILLGLGAWRLIEDEPQSQFTRGLGVMFTTLGAADLTTGVFAATRVSHEERRLERWNALKSDGVTEEELARAEGELRAASEMRQGDRLLVRWNGFTHAIAGVLVLAFSPLPDNSRTDRISAWVVGGLFVATGMSAFGLSFRPAPSEKAWEEYSQKKITLPANELTWRLSPAISRRGLGVGVSGTF